MRKIARLGKRGLLLLLLAGIGTGILIAGPGNREATVFLQRAQAGVHAEGTSELQAPASFPDAFSSETAQSGGEREESESVNAGAASEPELETAAAFRLDVPYLSQEGLLPTGCESVSALMVLRYYGYSTTAEEFVDQHLDRGALWEKDGVLYGPDPREAFVGDPWSSNGYGCYAPVIARAMRRASGGEMEVEDTTGTSLSALIKQEVRAGRPVLIWASMNMRPIKEGNSWMLEGSGKEFTWLSGEHCLVLIGEDEEAYWFNDPFQGNGVISFAKELVESRFERMGRQSVVMRAGKEQPPAALDADDDT